MKEIDCLGDICPVPIIKINKALSSASIGDSILVKTDHSCVSQSILDHFSKRNYSVDIDEVINGVWEITITVKKAR